MDWIPEKPEIPWMAKNAEIDQIGQIYWLRSWE